MATAAVPPPNVAPGPPVGGDSLYEVVDGQIVEKPMGAFSTWLASLLARYMGSFAAEHRLGRVVCEMLFRIDAATNLQRRPDVAFVSDRRWPLARQVPDEAAWDVVPDLAIEVVSPSNSAVEVVGKVDEYFRAGVQHVWVVYPSVAAIHVHDSPTAIRVLRRGDELDGAPLLPGFRLPLTTLFEGEPAPPA
jgi:Uma2 family endonuclease